MTNRVLFLTVLVILGCVGVFMIGSLTAPSSPRETTLDAPRVSDTQPMLFAVNMEAYRAIAVARNNGDSAAYMDLLSRGKAFLVTNGTKVRVEDVSGGIKWVTALDGPNAGRSGWVPGEWVR